jgi:dipeptidyl aminopeptidase/acylaminoacyl peptidase
VSPVAPFGRWPSPLSPAEVAASRLSRSALASDGRALWWLETRPEEGGATVLVRADPGAEPQVVSPPGTSVRSRVHEYGGGAWCLFPGAGEGAFAYVEDRSQQVFAALGGAEPVAISAPAPAGERRRHGGLVAGPGRSVLAVREAERDGGTERSVVVLDAGEGTEATLCAGHDFYGAPAVSPSGGRLAFVLWDHPNMPWDETELWVGQLARSAVVDAARVGAEVFAGASLDQPLFAGDGTLSFLADAAGWWQPWCLGQEGRLGRRSALEAEFQGPAWTLGQHTLVGVGGGRLACVWRRGGRDHVGVLAPDGALEELAQPCVAVQALCAHRGGLAWLGQSASAAPAVWWCPAGGAPVALTDPGSVLDADDVSVAEPVAFERDGRLIPAAFYPPRLAGWAGPEHERPPLVVFCHGGPTGSAGTGFDPAVQMLTTRGYAVVAVDYAGSTGYGRAYRRALEGRWGIDDVDDCVAVAAWLADHGRVEGRAMAIRGTSAGGFTALGALVRSARFAAGVSWYGISDLGALAETTHDFESRYTDRLVGAPADAARYAERSPIHHLDDLCGAVLLLQGEEDPVVPLAQTSALAEALAARGRRCEVRVFPGEGHGFRRADTLVEAYTAELAFYESVLLAAPGGDG